jgi:antitoxin FitA
MAVLTVRNLPEEVHRALRLRAAQHGRSMEAEVRAILEDTVKPPERVMLGALLHEMSGRAGLTNADVLALEASLTTVRDRAPHEPMRFD